MTLGQLDKGQILADQIRRLKSDIDNLEHNRNQGTIHFIEFELIRTGLKFGNNQTVLNQIADIVIKQLKTDLAPLEQEFEQL